MTPKDEKAGLLLRIVFIGFMIASTLAVSIYILSFPVSAADVKEVDGKSVKISITEPEEEWINEPFEAGITVNVNNGMEIKSVAVKMGNSDEKKDITETMTYTIVNNGPLSIIVKDMEGNSYEHEFEINYFDYEGPELIGAVSDGVLSLKTADEKSGVKSLIINGYEYNDCPGGDLEIRLSQFDASYEKFSIFVKDNLDNVSEEYVIDNPYFQTDEEKEDGDLSSKLPGSAEASAITSATGTVVKHATDYGFTYGAGEVLSASGNEVEDYDGMEFYLIKTESGKSFYMVIDKSSNENNAYLLTEADEGDLLNFTGVESMVLPKNGAVIAGTYQKTSEDEETVVKTGIFNNNPDESEEETVDKPKGNMNTVVLGVVAVAMFVGVVIFMKKKKKKQNSDNDDELIEDDNEEVISDDE